MKPLFFVLILFSSALAIASPTCAENETDTETKESYSEELWNITLSDWELEEPEHPGYLQLFFAYNIYKREAKSGKKIKGDKRKHCYFGCKISQDLSYEAAHYVAWYKEYKDLTDCNKKTLFEIKDFLYTLEGAEIGQESTNKALCSEACRDIPR